jgi:glycosyltransferase involved in cell wall biosynthesis
VRITPRQTVFVLLSFEGPDVYSQTGGLGVRVTGLSRALAQLGFETHLFFVGDPHLPGEESLENGRLHLHRWCQWISAQHRAGVYDDEEGKLRDWNRSLPLALIDAVIAPAIEAGRNVVVMAEEWQTAASINLISDSLHSRGQRDRVVMLWNANSTFSFWRINWGALGYVSTLTTVSRYMKFKMWNEGLNPVVIGNGIPRESITDPDPAAVSALRGAAGADNFGFKIGRFDPDKRWMTAIAAAAELKRSGSSVKLLVRGGREAYGEEVLGFARVRGLTVSSARAPESNEGLIDLLRTRPDADVVQLTSFLGGDQVMLAYAAADAVLANSGHEPFGLVGLEVMAAGGLAITGATGEDYADAMQNALVAESDDPAELVTLLRLVKERPALAAAIRKRGRATAREYVWDKVIDQLLVRVELAAARQAVRLGVADQGVAVPDRRRIVRKPRAKATK